MLGVIYGEGTSRFERLSQWLHIDRGAWASLGSILLFAGVLVLPLWAALVQCVVVYAHIVMRTAHARASATYRWVWTATTVLLATMAASWVFTALHGHLAYPGLRDLVAIALAVVVYSGVNLLVLLSGIYLMLRPSDVRAILPGRSDVFYELAKLLLSVLGAVLVVQAPLLTPTVLALAVILHRSSLVRQLVADATTDAKTGLLTPKAWDRTTLAELDRCRRKASPVALLALDLDHFKSVNDTHGHAVGDQVLGAVGALLNAQLRAIDVVGRYGGEEFVMLLPDTDLSDASVIAERVRRGIAQLEAAPGVRVTASVGMAVSANANAEIVDLFTAADNALYAAKAAGRDRVMCA